MSSRNRQPDSFGKETVLVCGGAGFIGSNFVRQMLERHPQLRIVNFDKLTYAGNRANLKDAEGDRRYSFVRGDIADARTVAGLFEKFAPGYLINFAAETHVDRSVHTGADPFLRTNVFGVRTLLEQLRRTPVRKFVQVSTDEVYGSLLLRGGKPFTEETPFAPRSPYSASKASGDLLCNAYHATWNLPVVRTHCSNNYGPYQYPEKLIPFFISRLMEGKSLPLYGDGRNVRDWLHVNDHCLALERCLLRGKPGRAYNIGGGAELSNRRVAKLLLRAFGRDESAIQYVADRPGHDRRYAIDASRISRELGWRPRIGFTEGFAETIAWYRDNERWMKAIFRRKARLNSHLN